MKDDEILILCDFSENFECKYSEEVQSMHFGASKNTITLHCGVIFWKNLSQSFVSVSDNNCHEPNTIWAHLIPVIKLAKEMNPHIKVIHFFSDGPCSQYRQKKNFYLLSLFTPKLKLSYSTWSFSEAGHAKSMADGTGGAVKRQLYKRISYGHDVTNATEAFQILENSMKTVKCFYISNQDIENMNQLIPNGIEAVPGTMQLHQISSTQCNQIKYRQLSCFCGEYRGLCSCYYPKIHNFVKPSKETAELSVEALIVPGTSKDNMNVTPCYLSLSIVPHKMNTAIDYEFPENTRQISSSPIEVISDHMLQDLETYQSDNEENINFDFHVGQMDETPIYSLEDSYISGPLIEITSLTDNQRLVEPKSDSIIPILESSCMTASDHVLGNTQNKQLKENLASLGCQPSKKRKINISNDNKHNGKEFKSSRTFLCSICKERQPFVIQRMVKCNACKNWVCLICSGTTFFDYVCSICLGTDE
ncbi:unnamed protein product [Parnassius mnemosyne]|uniref:Uncharacterized protein n=1 Tax=Parnassius mnemosyne TaxID=213953 RepID=A0AAV1LBZ2_9NEOP